MWGNVEYTVPMRHPHDHTVDACSARLVNNGFKGRDENFTALQTKTFLWGPLSGQEVLKPGHNKAQFTAVQMMNVFTTNRQLYTTDVEQYFKTSTELVFKLLTNIFQNRCVIIVEIIHHRWRWAHMKNRVFIFPNICMYNSFVYVMWGSDASYN